MLQSLYKFILYYIYIYTGPHKLAIPEAIQANGSAYVLPDILTVEVEQFYSWSAWTKKITSIAFIIFGLILNSSIGFDIIINKKFYIYPYFFLG